MKREFSVFMLAARSSIYKIILLIVATAAVEALLFFRTVNSHEYYFLEEVFISSRIAIVFMFSTLTLLQILIGPAKHGKSHQEYMIYRFGLPSSKIVFWWGLYNTLCIIIFFAAQIAIVIGICFVHLKNHTYITGDQTLFLAFYRSAFLHELMPMENLISWIRNILQAAALGFYIAYLCWFRRNNTGFILTLLFWLCFCTSIVYRVHSGDYMNFYNVLSIIVSLLLLIAITYKLLRKGAHFHEE